MITKARDVWYKSESCTVNNLIEYIENRGMMRDAQLDAIKTYLYLKVACNNRPLYALFTEGFFNTLDLDAVELSSASRQKLVNNPALAAMYEYAVSKNDAGEQASEKLERAIKKNPGAINPEDFFRKAFYDVTYSDYLYSLPMGAGKTYLMAAFIYLDLYFAHNEPNNPAFAHNFIVFAPSGLKSSVIPSLKTIQRFDSSWILPEPAATDVKRMMTFEVLDQNKTQSKSNKTKNPNVQKIANHQPLSELFGLVAVTNAEKVILDRIEEKKGQINMFESSDDEKDRQANELRNLIGKLPSLAIFIDEVHHAVSDEIKLRAVVNRWVKDNTINSVVGFSGTPYLEKTEKIQVLDDLSVGTDEISNIVNYYPLVDGIGNFLKRPILKISDTPNSDLIIENGVREFLDHYKDTVYKGGLTAKLGIYCGTIEKLEERVYPLVASICEEYDIGSEAILKFHKGNPAYPMPADSQLEFEALDTSLSKIRIVLLVQIGKEGWDCVSLTGIILSQEGDCPKKMVLQTSCRCLRQVEKHADETAIICLNEYNAGILEEQLEKQHHITIKEFETGGAGYTTILRYDRTKHLKLPKVDFYQLKINYDTQTLEAADPANSIPQVADDAMVKKSIVRTTDFSLNEIENTVDDEERGDKLATFNGWLYEITKGSFGSLTMTKLLEYESLLKPIFEKITVDNDGSTVFSSKYDVNKINANIRKAFAEKRDFTSTEELVPEESSLLNIANFKSEIQTNSPENYIPKQDEVGKIIKADEGKLKLDKRTADIIKNLEDTDNYDLANSLRSQFTADENKDRTYHYIPYKTDSSFEQRFFNEILSLPEIKDYNLEVYYNGDRAMTEFKIKCYKKSGNRWNYVGMYTPDFLIIQREKKKISKIVIVETKGEIYANDPKFIDKKLFMETEFTKQNNQKAGYNKFEYLYLEDSLSKSERITLAHDKIKQFFGGEGNAN